MVSDKLERFPALPLVQLAVTDDAEDPIRPPGQPVRECHTARNGDPLPQRTGGSIHAARFQAVRVAGQTRAVLVQRAQFFNREVALNRQGAVERRACMTFRQHKVIALRPVRIRRVDLHHGAVQHRQGFHHRHAAAVVPKAQLRQGFEGFKTDLTRQFGYLVLIHDLAPVFSCALLPAGLFFAKML